MKKLLILTSIIVALISLPIGVIIGYKLTAQEKFDYGYNVGSMRIKMDLHKKIHDFEHGNTEETELFSVKTMDVRMYKDKNKIVISTDK